MKNRICNLLDIEYPIIQGGMVWVSGWELALACSNAGILGTIGAGAMTLDELGNHISKMHENTDKPFAVNIPMMRPDAEKMGKYAINNGVGIIITSAGNPAKIAPVLKKNKVTLIHVVPSVKGACKAEKAGIDMVVCEGYEAGGHNSPHETTSLSLIPQIVDNVNIPVAAAGGISDGRGIAAAMALGADGVQMGTRFIATTECPAHKNFKKFITDAGDTDTCIIGRKLEMMRVVRNSFAQKMEQAEKEGADQDALLDIIGQKFNRSQIASINGDEKEGTFQAGQSAGLVNDIIAVEELVQRLVKEYNIARTSLDHF